MAILPFYIDRAINQCPVRTPEPGRPGSTCAMMLVMSTVGLRELRQNASDLVRRAEAGEEIIVTVSGRPSVRMVAAVPRAWRRYEDIAEVFSGRPDPDWEHDQDLIDQSIEDPWSAA
jgi:prevent-host-death family protein